MPLAEQTGLIVAADRDGAARWPPTRRPRGATQGIDARRGGQPVAADLLDAALPGAASRRLLEAARAADAALELEITESLLHDRSRSAARTLARLRALGVAIAVDDYGTGYSSLAYLRELPVDQLKIDRSFVTDIERRARDGRDRALDDRAGAQARAARRRRGRRGRRELDVLRGLGCDWSQGYLFTKPLPPASLVAWHRAAGFVAGFAGRGHQQLEGERDRPAVQNPLTVQDA